MRMNWKTIGKCLSDLFLPRLCTVCGQRLCPEEEVLCTGCLRDLPRTNYHKKSRNPSEELFYGRIPQRQMGRATSWFRYEKDILYKNILWQLKYYGQPETGRVMGRIMGSELQNDAFFEGIDLLIPVPLAKKKLRQRGYNQSDYIATGISEITGIPVITDCLRRTVPNESQTRKNRLERQTNVKGIFEAGECHRLEGKHILLIDDVLTSGATLIACAEALKDIKDIRFSFLAMAGAKL